MITQCPARIEHCRGGSGFHRCSCGAASAGCYSSWSSVTSRKGFWGSILGSWAHFSFLSALPAVPQLSWVGSWCSSRVVLTCLAAQRGISPVPMPPWVPADPDASLGCLQERAQEFFCSRTPKWHGVAIFFQYTHPRVQSGLEGGRDRSQGLLMNLPWLGFFWFLFICLSVPTWENLVSGILMLRLLWLKSQ